MMYVPRAVPEQTSTLLTFSQDGKIVWKVRAQAEPGRYPGDVLRQPSTAASPTATEKIFLHQSDDKLVALDAKTGKLEWSATKRRSFQGPDRHFRLPWWSKDKVLVGTLRRRVSASIAT